MKITKENLIKAGYDEHEGSFFKTTGRVRINVYLPKEFPLLVELETYAVDRQKNPVPFTVVLNINNMAKLNAFASALNL